MIGFATNGYYGGVSIALVTVGYYVQQGNVVVVPLQVGTPRLCPPNPVILSAGALLPDGTAVGVATIPVPIGTANELTPEITGGDNCIKNRR